MFVLLFPPWKLCHFLELDVIMKLAFITYIEYISQD